MRIRVSKIRGASCTERKGAGLGRRQGVREGWGMPVFGLQGRGGSVPLSPLKEIKEAAQGGHTDNRFRSGSRFESDRFKHPINRLAGCDHLGFRFRPWGSEIAKALVDPEQLVHAIGLLALVGACSGQAG